LLVFINSLDQNGVLCFPLNKSITVCTV